MRPSFIRIVHVSKYYPEKKGLMLELVEWDREVAHPGVRGQFRLSEFSDVEGFYNLKSAMKEAKGLTDEEVRVDLTLHV